MQRTEKLMYHPTLANIAGQVTLQIDVWSVAEGGALEAKALGTLSLPILQILSELVLPKL